MHGWVSDLRSRVMRTSVMTRPMPSVSSIKTAPRTIAGNMVTAFQSTTKKSGKNTAGFRWINPFNRTGILKLAMSRC